MAQSPVAGGMHKGLPTFRAGGSTSRNNLATSRDEDGVNHKSALKPSFFSHDHFSSSVAKSEGAVCERVVQVTMSCASTTVKSRDVAKQRFLSRSTTNTAQDEFRI